MTEARPITNLALAQARAHHSPAYADIVTHLAAYVARVLTHLAIPPVAVTVLDSETNVTVRVDAPAGRYVLKISPWPDDLYVSTYFFQRLQSHGIPLPPLIWFDDRRSVIPYDVQVLGWIEGVAGHALPAHLQQAAGLLMGQALRQIHRLPTDGAGCPLPAGGWSAASWLPALRHSWQYERAVTRALFRPHESAAIEALIWADERMEVAQPRLIHGDVVAANGLFRVEGGQVRLAALIDPGGMVGGDPMFDLAGGTDTPEAFAQGVWAGYIAHRALAPDEAYRYRRLLLWSYYTAAHWHYVVGQESTPWVARTRRALQELRGPSRQIPY